MADSEEENPENLQWMMTIQLMDSDSSLLFDQNYSVSPPLPPSLLSLITSPSQNPCLILSPNLPSSPLWNFSDGFEQNSGGKSTVGLTDCSQLVSCNFNSVSGDLVQNTNKRVFLPPAMELTLTKYQDASCMIKERMIEALGYLKESTEQNMLIQFWAPIKNGNRHVLTTSGQPVVLDSCCNGLFQCRMVSLTYMFSADGESYGDLGLPGRVLHRKLAVLTPSVQYYNSKEYLQLNHALNYNIQETLAMPVFETSGQSCIGVAELIMTSQKINYASEVDKVCKALEAVNLRSSGILGSSSIQIINKGHQNSLVEILEILTMVCENHHWLKPGFHANIAMF